MTESSVLAGLGVLGGLSRAFSGVQPDDGSEDVFVHISAVEQSALAQVVEGQKVQFDLEHGRQGKLAAAKVRAG